LVVRCLLRAATWLLRRFVAHLQSDLTLRVVNSFRQDFKSFNL
jgi:hypothetical protein